MNHQFPICSEWDAQVAEPWAGLCLVAQKNEWSLGVGVDSVPAEELGRVTTTCLSFFTLREDVHPPVWLGDSNGL